MRMAAMGLVLALAVAGCDGAGAVGDDDGGGQPGPDSAIPARDGSTPGPDSSTPVPPSGRWVMGYYVGYQRDLLPAAEIDFSGLTHLAVGRVTPNADGTLGTTFDVDATQGPIMARDLVMRTHAAGKKAILMVGGAGEHDGFAAASSDARRATFVTNLVRLRTDYGFDGFDLDWEPVTAADQPNLRALAMALRAASPGVQLTLPVGWVNANFPTVEPFYAQIAPLFDQINIMSYGMAGSWDGWRVWHSSALTGHEAANPSSVSSSVDAYLAAGIPAAKLGVGIGFYGSCWTGATMPRASGAGAALVADDNVMSFTNIMQSYFQTAAYRYDDVAKAPYLTFAAAHGPRNCTLVSYEDERSIADKGRYVKQKNLGGAIIWTINQGHRPALPVGQRDPLLAVTRDEIVK